MLDPIHVRMPWHQVNNHRWVLCTPYNYGNLWLTNRRKYYALLRSEWMHHFHESNGLVEDLRALFSPLVCRHSLSIPWWTLEEYAKAVVQIREENNRMLIRWTHFGLLSLASETAQDNNRVLTVDELNVFHQNFAYQSDFPMSDEEGS